MVNGFTSLDSSFIEGRSSAEVDDVFITRMLWADEDEDFMTAYDLHLAVFSYPGLDTIEEVYDKTYALMEKMLHQELLICETLNGDINFEELNKHKDVIYRVMKNECTGEEMYKFIFAITDKGQEFLQTHLPQYQPILNEIGRLFYEDIQRGEKKRKSQD